MSLPQRTWTRLSTYDYGRPGAYFVATCLRIRGFLLGTVTTDVVRLSPCGEIVAAQLDALERRFPDVAVDTSIVMADHVHAIVVLGRAGDGRATQERSRQASTLRTVVGSFKAGSAREINRLSGTVGEGLWQRGFYEHVIRDDADLDRIREYILTNPLRWTLARTPPGLPHRPLDRRDEACLVRPGDRRQRSPSRDASSVPATGDTDRPVGTRLASSVPATGDRIALRGRGVPRPRRARVTEAQRGAVEASLAPTSGRAAPTT